MSQIAFNTANLVARVTGYRFELRHWGDQHQRTIRETDESEWRDICERIAGLGYRAAEVWEAHAAPEALDAAKAGVWKRIMEDAGLEPVGYAGGLRPETTQVCQWLGIPRINGGLNRTVEEATELCRSSEIEFNFENHPQKSAQEILDAVGGGNRWLGVCIDTGWLGTQGVPAPEAIRLCGDRVRHVHVKDVKAHGGHDTCLLGEGVVDVAGCIAALKEIGYVGWYSWEDEPENRNPFDSAARNREWIEAQLGD
jgi:sugar phosphate isomerase/epimerase